LWCKWRLSSGCWLGGPLHHWRNSLCPTSALKAGFGLRINQQSLIFFSEQGHTECTQVKQCKVTTDKWYIKFVHVQDIQYLGMDISTSNVESRGWHWSLPSSRCCVLQDFMQTTIVQSKQLKVIQTSSPW
jgi:hypothetical protein